jgi:hypothetical protein
MRAKAHYALASEVRFITADDTTPSPILRQENYAQLPASPG